MKTAALLSMVLVLPTASLLAKGQSEIEILRSRVEMQERRINQLEKALNRLQGVEDHKASPGSSVQKKSPVKAAGGKTSTQDYLVVKGDVLTRIAHRHHTTVEAIKKENGLKRDLILVGQKLRIPVPSANVAKKSKKVKSQQVVKKSAPSKPSVAGTHTVKAGETFYGIARQYKMSESSLRAANPNVKPASLQIGQVLVIDASAKPQVAAKSPTKSVKKAAAKPVVSSEVKKSVVAKAPEKKASVKKTPEKKKLVTSTPLSEFSKSTTYRTVTVERQMSYSTFARKYRTSTAKLNSLNGLDLSRTAVLAKGSELYVPED